MFTRKRTLHACWRSVAARACPHCLAGRALSAEVLPWGKPSDGNQGTDEGGNEVGERKMHAPCGAGLVSAFGQAGERGGTAATGASWEEAVARLGEELRQRRYSLGTVRVYVFHVRRFAAFCEAVPVEELTGRHAQRFLRFLAVDGKFSISTRNLACNALLFFFRHVLGRSMCEGKGAERRKRPTPTPLVLSREEIDGLLGRLDRPFDLIVKLLYGCGLRLCECLNMRLHSLDISAGTLSIPGRRGRKDRQVPLPKSILPELRDHVEGLRGLHRRDLARGYDGVFLLAATEKTPAAFAKSFEWQWLFPAPRLTRERDSGHLRRYHLHQSLVQKALRRAVHEAGLDKRATPHTFRHSYASHLLQNNFDVRTVQTLLGHGDVRTTMIYARTVRCRSLDEAESPLDL